MNTPNTESLQILLEREESDRDAIALTVRQAQDHLERTCRERRLCKESVAQAACGHFEGLARCLSGRPHGDLSHHTGQPQGRRLGLNPIRIRIRIGPAKAVVAVRHRELPGKFPAQAGQAVEQHHGIQATGHSHHQVPRPGSEPLRPMPAELLQKSIHQRHNTG